MASILGNDLLNDSLSGTAGADLVQGMGGDDTLLGRGGSDTLEGGDGNDYLNGGTGVNYLLGGAGDDTYELNSTLDVVMESFNEGYDRIRSWASGAVLTANVEVLELLGTAAIGYGNELSNEIYGNNALNTLVGDSGDDRIEGRGGNDVLAGGIGNDSLLGGTDNDQLQGEDGNDTLDGGTGADTMLGAAGDDVYRVDNAGDVVSDVVDGGLDVVASTINYTLGSDLEILMLLGGASKGSGNELGNWITGNALANVLRGGAGNDELNGGDGNDVLWGDGGSDRLRGGYGSDVYQLVRGAGIDRVEDFGDGEYDTLRFGNANVSHLKLWFTRAGDDLQVIGLGTTGHALVVGYFTDLAHGWRIQLGDGAWIDRAGIDRLVDSMSLLPVPATAPLPSTGEYSGVYDLVGRVWYNTAPMGLDLSGDHVAENSLGGTFVGLLSAVDGNAGDQFTYSLVDDAGGRFEIVGEELRVATGAILDFESQTSHLVTVRVTDEGGLSFDRDFTIVVDNESPVISGSPGNDSISGTSEEDLIQGLAGNDTLEGGGVGADTLVGGAGDDVLRDAVQADYLRDVSYFDVSRTQTGILLVDDKVGGAGDEGSDSLDGVGRARFSDGTTVSLTAPRDVRVNETGADTQANASVTTLAGGGYVVCWESAGQDGGGNGVFFQRYDAAGIALGVETRANTTTTSNQESASIAALTDGGFVIAWNSYGQGADAFKGVYFQRYDAGGSAVGGEVHANTTTAADQQAPAVAGLAGGGFVVTWQSYGQDFIATQGVYQQRYTSAGATAGSETRVNTYTSYDQSAPSVAALTDGGHVVAWQSYAQDGSFWGVYFKRFDAAGNVVLAETRANNYTLADQAAPSVTSLADGGYVIAWQSWAQDGSFQGVYLQRYSSTNALVGGEVAVNGYTSLDQMQPAVASLADGGFVVAWQSWAQDGSAEGIYIRRYNAAGALVLGDTLVNTTTAGAQLNPAVSGLPDGGYVVTWTAPDSSSTGIFMQRFDAANQPQAGGLAWEAGSFPMIFGSASADDVMTGTSNADEMYGQAGHDVLNGLAGNDSLEGDQGDDTLSGGAGNDTISGTAGIDVATYAGLQKDFTYSVTGVGFVNVQDNVTADGNEGIDQLQHIDTILFGDGVRAAPLAASLGLYVIGTGSADFLRGTAGGDSLAGNSGDDTLAGLGGNDSFVGGSGEDVLQWLAAETLDLTAIADTQVTGIERVDLGGSGVLVLNLAELTNLSDTDVLHVFNGATGTVTKGAGWTDMGMDATETTFHRYEQSGAVLLIEQGITVV